MKDIIKLLSIIAILSAALPSSAVSSPAATQSWVSNYVAKAMANAVTDDLPTNCAAADVDTSGNLCFTYNGVDYSYHVTVTNRAADVEAYRVYSSTSPSAVPVGTVYASDGSGSYVNDGIPFPNALRLTVTNGVRHLDQSNGVWVAESSGTTNSVFVNVSSNGVYSFSLKLSKFTVTESEARSIGVTNFATAAFGPVKTDFLDVVREIFFGSAYADDLASGGSSAASFEYLVTYDNLADGVVRTVSVLFTYGGEYHDWNVYPESPHPAADDEHYYVPNSWPYSYEWSLASKWKAAGTGDKIYLTSYIDNAGVMEELTITVKLSRLEKLGNKTLSECIPPFTPPQYLEREKSDMCNRNNHYWVHCVCRDCGEEKDHNLVRKSGSATCNRCNNYQGRASSHLSELCGSTKSHGDVKSSIGNHYGWHDSDGAYGNMMACTCECGDWNTVHDPSGTKSDIGEGYYDIKQRITLPNTDEEYHHFSMMCNASKGDNTYCGAAVVYNESHDYKAADGSVPHPIIGDKNDEENIIHLSQGEQSDAANEEYHYAQGMECTVCGKEADKYDDHAFPSQASGIEACTCEGCGLIVHRQDGGWTCGTKDVPGCKTCKTYSKTGSRWKDRISNLTEDLHDYKSAGATLTETTHTCACGLSTYNHYFVKKDDTTWVCDVCGYEYEKEDGEEPPEFLRRNYVISGFCGNWIKRDGTVFTGGNDKLSDGTDVYFPTGHNFDCLTLFPELLCYQCVNVSPLDGKYCAHFSADDIKKHGGWHDISNRCHCVCGMFSQDHHMAALGDGSVYHFSKGSSNECLKVGKCDNIGPNTSHDDYCHADVSNEVDHAYFIATNDAYTVESDTNHFVRLVCMHEFETLNREHPGCGFTTNALEAHSWTNGVFFKYDETYHKLREECELCGYVHTNGTYIGLHEGVVTSATARVAGSVKYHELGYFCNVCTNFYKPVADSEEAPVQELCVGEGVYTLGKTFSDPDRQACFRKSLGCTNLVECGHDFGHDETTHWCKRGNRHLRGKHVYDNPIELTSPNGDKILAASGKCAICGYVNTLDEETLSVPETSLCGDCKCSPDPRETYRYYITSNDVKYVSTTFYRAAEGYRQCRFWDAYLGICGCYRCNPRNGVPVPARCACSYEGDGYLYSCDEIVTANLYRGRWARSANVYGFDGSDPVYEVRSRAFEDAFASCPNFGYLNMPYVTNVETRAFLGCASNCTALAYVNFGGLKKAGSQAFQDAFNGCSGLTAVNFNSLEEVGANGFLNAFKDASTLKNLSFQSLVKAGDSALSFGTGCAIENLSVPRLDDIGETSFAQLTNLKTLDLSEVSSNSLQKIGNLSSLTNLVEINFCLAESVLPYYTSGGEEHLVPGNSQYMWIVPDDLYEEWVAAPGWCEHSYHVVSNSNPVLGEAVKVTVSFDTGYGDPVEPMTIVQGEGISPTTNIYKYAASLGGHDNGFAFAGWYRDAALTVPYTNNFAIVSNTTLYAKWNNNCSLSIHQNGPFEQVIEGCTNYSVIVWLMSCETGFLRENLEGKLKLYYMDSTAQYPTRSIPYTMTDSGGMVRLDCQFILPTPITADEKTLVVWCQIESFDTLNQFSSDSITITFRKE